MISASHPNYIAPLATPLAQVSLLVLIQMESPDCFLGERSPSSHSITSTSRQ